MTGRTTPRHRARAWRPLAFRDRNPLCSIQGRPSSRKSAIEQPGLAADGYLRRGFAEKLQFRGDFKFLLAAETPASAENLV